MYFYIYFVPNQFQDTQGSKQEYPCSKLIFYGYENLMMWIYLLFYRNLYPH